jgi:hypothetical protein
MRPCSREIALLLLAGALFSLALFRTVHAILLWRGLSLERAVLPASAPILPGEEILAEAERRDRTVERREGETPQRDPFRISASPQRRERPAGPGIPRPVLVVDEEGAEKVVLAIGPHQSPPLAPGDSFQDWKVLALGEGRVLVEREGVLYTLPLP